MKPRQRQIASYLVYALLICIVLVVGIHLINAYDHNIDKQKKVDTTAMIKEFQSELENNTFHFENTKSVLKGMAILGVAIAAFLLWRIDESKKKRMPGGEYGTSDWENPRKLKKYWDKDYRKNIILTQNVKFVWDNNKTGINMNTLCLGSSGSGKTFKFFKPNVMNAYGCYIVVDPKLDILAKEGGILKKEGYDIKMFNIDNLSQSNYYNPLNYIEEDDDVIHLVKSLLLNTKADQNASSSDGFWDDASELLLLTLISYVKYCFPKEKQTIPDVLDLMLEANEFQKRDNNGEKEEITLLDLKIEQLEKQIAAKKRANPDDKCPESVVIEHYKGFKLAPKKTSMSILISVMARLKFYNIESIRNSSMRDEMELDQIGMKKMAIFISIPPTDRSKDFLSSIMFTQILKIIERNAKKSPQFKLAIPTRIMIDEAKNVGKIPNIIEAIAYVRSFDAGITLVYQSLAQMQQQYKDEWKEIIDNCDSFLFLKGSEVETTKYISEKLGKTTIYIRNRSVSKGSNASFSDNEQAMARNLMEPDEVGKIGEDECILFVQGRPYFDRKYNTLRHPRVKETCEYHPNWLDNIKGYQPVKPYNFKADLERKRRSRNAIEEKEMIISAGDSDGSEMSQTEILNEVLNIEEILKEQVNSFVEEKEEKSKGIDEVMNIIYECFADDMKVLKERNKDAGIDLVKLGMIEEDEAMSDQLIEVLAERGIEVTKDIEDIVKEELSKIETKNKEASIYNVIEDNLSKEVDVPLVLLEKINAEVKEKQESLNVINIPKEQIEEILREDELDIDDSEIEEDNSEDIEDFLGELEEEMQMN
ncbi:MAG: type IV secretory system conjugative DNA transfer family protein [Lachnospiraceae bacterium]|nr:type IV secretory system conjugative DNA transfer family protein [Lachnospiraceae bacterium]